MTYETVFIQNFAKATLFYHKVGELADAAIMQDFRLCRIGNSSM